MLLDPNPHSQHETGSRTAKLLQINADPDPQVIDFFSKRAKMRPFSFRVAPPPPPPPGSWPRLSCSGRRALGTAPSHRPVLHHRHVSYLCAYATIMPACWGRWMRRVSAVLRIGIRDPVPFWPLDPGSRMGRKTASGSGMNNPDHIF